MGPKRQVYRQQISGYLSVRLQTGVYFCGVRMKAVCLSAENEVASDGCTNLLKHLQ